VRHRLIAPEAPPAPAGDYKRWERHRPMELWQIDVMGGMRRLVTSQASALEMGSSSDDRLTNR
jgi:hypothetical protein